MGKQTLGPPSIQGRGQPRGPAGLGRGDIVSYHERPHGRLGGGSAPGAAPAVRAAQLSRHRVTDGTGSGTGSAQAQTWVAPGAPAPNAKSSSQRLHPDRQERKQRSGLRERRPRPEQRRPRPPATRQQGTGDVYDNLVRRAFAETVHPGRLLFNPPNQMRLGQTERVEVRLTRTLTLDAKLLERLHGRGEPQLEEIPTAPLMAVTLKGDGFRITAYSDEEQIVTHEGLTMWEYDIRALKRGQQRLVTCVSLRIPVAGQPFEHKSIPVREATIDVQVGAPALVAYFIVGNWQWFIGTAIAIAAVLVAVFH